MRCNKSGFTMAELLVSIAILLIIAVAIAGDINRSKYQEELSSSVRILAGALRDAQARALTARTVNSCWGGAAYFVCETNGAICGGTCDTQKPPSTMGVTLTTGATS